MFMFSMNTLTRNGYFRFKQLSLCLQVITNVHFYCYEYHFKYKQILMFNKKKFLLNVYALLIMILINVAVTSHAICQVGCKNNF